MTIRIPAEWEPHTCCWMAWAVHAEWKDWVDKVKDELQAVIHTIARFEQVRLLTPRDYVSDARARFAGGNVEVVEAPVDDIWMRDIAPTFAPRDGKVVALDFNFNAWGNGSLPDIPTAQEAGFKSLTIDGLTGLFASFGMPISLR